MARKQQEVNTEVHELRAQWPKERIKAVIGSWPCSRKLLADLFEAAVECGEGSTLQRDLLEVAREMPGCIRRVCGPLDKMDMTRSAYQLMEHVLGDFYVRSGQMPTRSPHRNRSADGMPSPAFQ